MANPVQITAEDFEGMVRHWLETPVDGYLGSDYGIDSKALLQRPMEGSETNEFLVKMRADLPLLQVLPDSAINVFFENTAPDKKRLHVTLGSRTITVGG